MASCTTNMSKGALYFVNTLFILIGLATLTASVAITVEDKWSKFFDKSTLTFLIGSSFAIFFIAMLGCCGAMKQKKRYLLPYILFVFLALVIQIVGCYFVLDYNTAMAGAEKAGFDQSDYSSAQTRAMNFIKDGTTKVYTEGNCALDAGSLRVTCDKDAKWFETFINTQCPSEDPKSVPAVVQCIEENTGTSSTSVQDENTVYCGCRQQLVAKVKTISGPLAIAAVSLMALELLLVLFAMRIVCAGHKKTEEEKQRDLISHDQHYNPPFSNQQGAPVVAQGANIV